jgi:FkbM family methyltransferase
VRLDNLTLANKMAKALAKPLSGLVANRVTYDLARLAGVYWSILLGKGAGSGWDLASEIKATHYAVRSSAPVVFDVGANKGHWALMLQQEFPTARLFLFEPQLACREIISKAGLRDYTLIPKAVSARCGDRVQMFTSGPASQVASLHERRDTYFSAASFTSFEVETVTIDSVIDQYQLTSVDFLKMDIEGHELEALKGAQKGLASGVIKALAFEFGSGNINSRTFFHDFWDFLIPLGFRIHRILPFGLHAIHEYDEDCEYFRGVTNYVAIRRL